MKVLELFAGTRSIGKAFKAAGHEVFSVEWSKDFENIDLYADILTVTAADILEKFGKPDVIWASPDCSTFSIAAISHHRRKNPETGNLDPVSDYAKFCDKVNENVQVLIDDLNKMRLDAGLGELLHQLLHLIQLVLHQCYLLHLNQFDLFRHKLLEQFHQ